MLKPMSTAHTPNSPKTPGSSEPAELPGEAKRHQPENPAAAAHGSEHASAAEADRGSAGGASDQVIDYTQVRIRRAPSIPAFMVLGLVIGLVAAFVSVWFGPDDPSYTFEAVFGVIAVIFGAVGTAVGAGVALWLDRRSVKKYRTASVEPEDGIYGDSVPEE